MKLETIVCIKNCVALVCFTALAIVFAKWWIVLFSIIFFSGVDYGKNKKGE